MRLYFVHAPIALFLLLLLQKMQYSQFNRETTKIAYLGFIGTSFINASAIVECGVMGVSCSSGPTWISLLEYM